MSNNIATSLIPRLGDDWLGAYSRIEVDVIPIGKSFVS